VALVHEEGTLLRCSACGLVSVDPLPTPQDALALYDTAYFRGGTGYRDYVGEEPVFRAEFRRRLRRIRAAGGKGRLLDVGAATGACLLEARDQGFQAQGIEPSEPIARMARSRGLDVVTSAVESAVYAPASFDVVSCFDVLEHLVDPLRALRRIHGWMRPGGILSVTVPNFGGYWSQLTRTKWPFLTPTEHLHYFERASLRRLLARGGFRVTTVSRGGAPATVGRMVRGLPGLGREADWALGRLVDVGFAVPIGTLFAVAVAESETSAA
jgi:SAM-dependent methyltransferase